MGLYLWEKTGSRAYGWKRPISLDGVDFRLYVLLETAAGEPDPGNPHVRFDEGEEESDE